MKPGVSIKAVGQASGIFLAVTFTLCVLFDLVFPHYAMYPLWEGLLPGFRWLSWPSWLLGVVETYVYGWYFALLWVPLYNYFGRKPRATE